MPCRYNRRRIWATRIEVEALQYKDNAFVTLTYDPAKQPESVKPEDVKTFIKNLRARYQYWQEKEKIKDVKKLRFFAVGEYGEQNGKAHYHCMLFNFPTCVYRRSQYSKKRTECCVWCDMVRDAWGKGFVYLGEVEGDSAGYISGYVVKKMTSKDDPRLEGRHPEFARMSLKPGIGAFAMFDVADTLLNYQNTLDTLTDVPGEIRIAGSLRPVGRYLHKKLREYVGREAQAPQAIMDKLQEEMRPVQMAARSSKENPSFKQQVIDAGAGKRAAMESRARIFKSKRSL